MAFRDDFVVLTMVLNGPSVVYQPAGVTTDPGQSPFSVYPDFTSFSDDLVKKLRSWALTGEYYMVQMTVGPPLDRPYNIASEAELYYAWGYGMYPYEYMYGGRTPAADSMEFDPNEFYVAAWSTKGLRGLRLDITIPIVGA